jgi:hypothetical protein
VAVTLAGTFSGDFCAFFAGLGKPDGYGLFAAFYYTAFSTFAGLKCASLFAVHGAFDAVRGRFAVFAPTGFLSRSARCSHGSSPN